VLRASNNKENLMKLLHYPEKVMISPESSSKGLYHKFSQVCIGQTLELLVRYESGERTLEFFNVEGVSLFKLSSSCKKIC
jgi:hypothetical protein